MSDTYYSSGVSGGIASVPVTWTGAIPNTNQNILLYVVGALVQLQFAELNVVATSTNPIIGSTVLPAAFRPIFTLDMAFTTIVNGVSAAGNIEILAGDGSINVYANLNNGSFTSGQSSGFNSQSLSFIRNIA